MLKKLLIGVAFFLPVTGHAQPASLKYQIRYKSNQYELSDRNKQTLSILFDTLREKKNYIIYINGHSDSDADSSYNQQLSLKRSLAVKEFFMAKGMDETLIKVQAKGEEQPLVANTTPLGKAKNRRVEIVVLFLQMPQEEIIEPKKELIEPGCKGDTTVQMEGGYVVTLSKCDWERNKECLRVRKRLTYKFNVKENWLKKHLGFRNYKKIINYDSHYEFYVVACLDSCFQNKIKLYIPQYSARGLKVSEPYAQKRNDKNQQATLLFKKTKLGDSAYYVADIFCPGTLHCGTDNRCTHDVILRGKNNIKILSYTYYTWNPFFYEDSAKAVQPLYGRKIKENYRNTFFQTLDILHKGDTIRFKRIPIDVFAHGINKIKVKGGKNDKAYFLFIPYRKRYKCGHFKRYKIRTKDIERLKNFDLQDLEIEN